MAMGFANIHGWGGEVSEVAATAKEGLLAGRLAEKKPAVLGVAETHFPHGDGPSTQFLNEVGYVWIGRTSNQIGGNGDGMGGVGLLIRKDIAGSKRGVGTKTFGYTQHRKE